MDAYPNNPTIIMDYHDDWLAHVLLSDGRIYSYWTECWSEHGRGLDNWAEVMPTARKLALQDAARGTATWALDILPEDINGLKSGLNDLCLRISDRDFNRFIQIRIG